VSFAKTLLQRTTRVYEALERSSLGAPRERYWIRKGLSESCAALTDLLTDPEFKAFIEDERRRVAIEEGRALLAEYSKNRDALNQFLLAERDLFGRAGMPASLTEHLLRRCHDLIASPPRERTEISTALGDLQNLVCTQSDSLDQARRRGVVGGMFGVLGGLSIVALNGGLLAATVGLSGAQCAASGALGSLVAGEGYNTVRRHF
jgi:hypothetical protein